MEDLNGAALKLWLYLNKNQDGFTLELSKAACKSWGIPEGSYQRAKAELIEKGYLVRQEGSNQFLFYEEGAAADPDHQQPDPDHGEDRNDLHTSGIKTIPEKIETIPKKDQNDPRQDQNGMRNITIDKTKNKTKNTRATVPTVAPQPQDPPIIPMGMYDLIVSRIEEIGGGLVRVEATQKVFRWPDGVPFRQPKAHLEEQKINKQ